MNKTAFHKISYGLYIITSGQDGKFNGQIANSLFQVTSNPPTVAVSINKENYTHELITASRKFVVSVLSQDTPMTFIGLFGFKSGRSVDKLKDIKTKTGVTGIPIVLDNVLSFIEAEVENEMSCGTHTIFFAKAVEADIIGEGEPLTYAYYQSVKGGKSSQNAPTYIQDEPKAKTTSKVSARYVCSICGYIYDPEKGDPDGGIAPGTAFEDIPDSWTCPICGAEKAKFEKEK
ncbi:MAG: flavin reductase [Smithellaceae bacterium]|jgi:flavin reductase (DIM6/NTAB) family NADH-FMN oxidoreductase RutF/rubredoxin|nr:rubredoxin [Syntrophaceae bacterium]MBP8608214.1 rubredoxin [Syntrophaceae bacterium]NMD05711.1 High molecular weight rubredoxin [Deltaproteobacteria bacterium]